MEVRKITVTNPHGLHMRASAEIAKAANKYESKIYLCHRCKFADSCSIIQILTLGAIRNSEIAVIVEGPDEKEAVENICKLFVEKK